MNHGAMIFGERRQFVRKDCLRIIGINNFKKLYIGYLRDLALGGAFIEPKDEDNSMVGQEILLSIPFGAKSGYVNLMAKIEWVKKDGIGVRFLTSRALDRAYA